MKMGSSARTQRNKKSRVFHGNRYIKKQNVNNVNMNSVSDNIPSTSNQTFGHVHSSVSENCDNLGLGSVNSRNNTELAYNIILDTECLQNIISIVACPECLSCGSLTISDDENKRQGWAISLSLMCNKCPYKSSEFTSSKKQGKVPVINRRLVYAMREVGCGYGEARKLSYLLNMPPPPTTNSYQAHVKALCSVVSELAEKSMSTAAEEIHQLTGGECGVSVDGTWHRRGFSSLSGVVTVISVDTGKVLDTQILTKDCISCRKHSGLDKHSPAYISWWAEHEPLCDANYKGSSPNMEPTGAAQIFLRSKEIRNLEYVKYYGDGDSKSYKYVVDSDPYNGKKIEKLECVGHYQKRLGTALRKIAAEKKLGGKGKLTGVMINKLQNYFGIALRCNTSSIQIMSKSIWATLFHLSARDDQPLHGKCPEGATSWCSFQRAVAAGKQDTYKHKAGLPLEIVRAIKPVYERLTDPDMLSKCLHGKTQNANESFNGMIWNRCPKETYIGRKNLQLGVMDAICHFNLGNTVELDILKKMGITPGKFTVAGVGVAQDVKLQQAEKQCTPEQKQRRRYLRGRKKMKEDKRTQQEGPTYAAGEF
jgi:hypothetical protein